ncbi:MAG: site-specific integrase [Clostridia bacterium]|nr:site-specific integrase [Clostridia bacterium]
MKFLQWQKRWLEIYKQPRVKHHTYLIYKSVLEIHINPHFEQMEIEEIGADTIYDFLYQKLKSGNKKNGCKMTAASVNLMRAIIKSIFEDALKAGLVKSNPCTLVKRFSGKEREMRVFTKREQSELERRCLREGDSLHIGILIALYTGLRIGELLALKWGDVDLRSKLFRIQRTKYCAKDTDGQWRNLYDTPKSKSSKRDIPIAPSLINILSREKARATGEFVIINEKGESPNIRNYQHFFAKMQINIVKNPLNFHALRHTFATRAVEAGVDIKTLSELMGHKDATLTLNRYSHSLLDTKKKAMCRLELYMSAK